MTSRLQIVLEQPTLFDGSALLVFFGRHAVPGIETYSDHVGEDGSRRLHYARTLRLPHGPAVVELTWANGTLSAAAQVTDGRDLAAVGQRVEHLCDLTRDLDPVERHLSRDPELSALVRASPGLRVPGSADAHEQLFRTMIGQQISLAGAANCAAKLVARFGEPLPSSVRNAVEASTSGKLTSLFPTAAALAAASPDTLPMPKARGRALVAMAASLASKEVLLDVDSDPVETRAQLLARPGVGPWTADYVLMRALHDPDILLASDLVIRRELLRLNITNTADWSPWRSYATMHLWRVWTG